MRDIAFAWLAKDAASYGMADYATEIGLVLTRGFGNVGIGCFAVKRNMSRNIESADTLESQIVEKLYEPAISAAVFSRLVARTQLGKEPWCCGTAGEKAVEKKVVLTLQDAQRMCSRGPTIRSCNSCVALTTTRRAC